jgi:hypothetical protein
MDNYSSLFTMGLLSERASPVSSSRSPRSPRSSFFSKFRKSSLPTKALSKPSELYSRGEGRFYPNNDPPPQFTNPFGDSPAAATNNNDELPSFLPLDLAANSTSIARRSSKFLSPLDMSPSTAYSATIPPYVSNATNTEIYLTRFSTDANATQTAWLPYPFLHHGSLPVTLFEHCHLQDLRLLPHCPKSHLSVNALVLYRP